MKSLLTKIKEAGLPYTTYESDVHLPVSPLADELLGEYPHRGNVTVFIDSKGVNTFNIPFENEDFWEIKGRFRCLGGLV